MTDSTEGSAEASASVAPVRRRRAGRIVLIVLGSIVGVVLLAVVGGLLALEGVVNSRKDAELAKLAAALGRPVTAGPVDVNVLSGGRVVIKDVVIGRDPNIPNEPDPVVKVDRAYVNMKLLPVMFSLGKKLVVQDVAVEGLALQVARLPDGRLNLQDIADKLPKTEVTEAAKEDKQVPLDEETRQQIRNARVEHIRLTDARMRFVDLTAQGAPAAEIADLDVVIDDVSLSNAFAVKVAAAVLGVKQNFQLEARVGPSPDVPGEIAPPPLERAHVKLDPTPLKPLAPFLATVAAPELSELTDGTLAMDLEAVPGAATPGGAGPTTLKGFLALAGAKFAGGEAFEARLDSDVSADVPAGTADIRKFVAKLVGATGEMALEAKGKLANLLGAEPRVEGFNLESRGLDFTRIRAHYPALDRTAGAILRGPFLVLAKGSGDAAGRGQLDARMDLTPASIEVPGQFRKPAGARLVLELAAVTEPNLLRAERVLLTMANWTIKASGSLRTQGTGKAARQSFEGTVEAPMLPVRDLVALVAPKQLGEVPDMKVGAKAAARGVVGNPRSMKIDVPSFQVTAGRSDLSGNLSLENLEAPKVAFDGRSKFLDMDDFLPPGQKAAKQKGAPGAGKPAQTGKASGKASEQPPELLQQLDGVAKLTVARGRAAEIDYSDLKADLKVKRGRLAARTLEVNALGGHFSGAGSEFPLVEEDGVVVARGEVQRMDVAQALATFGKRNLLAGKLSAKVDITGKGTAPELIKETLSGKLTGSLEDGQFLPASLLEPVAATLMQASDKFPVLGKQVRAAAERATVLADKQLRDLRGALGFSGGAAEILKPLEGDTPGGRVSVDGRVNLDGAYDMLAKLQLKPEVATALTGGKVRFDQAIPVDLKITGPLARPQIRPADPVALTKVFATALAKTEAGEFMKQKAGVALERVGGTEAKEKLDEARVRAQQAEAQGAQRAEAARQEAEERAAKAKEQAADKAKEAAGSKLRGILGR